jgi:hypothetical protein
MKFVDDDVIDNLTKMTKHILEPDMEKLESFGFKTASNPDEGIEERVTLARAQELLAAWKKIKVEAENSPKE